MTTCHNAPTSQIITQQKPSFNVRMAVSAATVYNNPTMTYRYLKGQWKPREWRIGFDGLQYNATRYEVSELIHTRNPSQVRTHYQKVKYKGRVNCFHLASVGAFVPQVVDEHDKAMMSLDHNALPLPKCHGPLSTRETWLALRALFQWGIRPEKIAWCIGTRRTEDIVAVLPVLEALANAHGFRHSRRSLRIRHKLQNAAGTRQTSTVSKKEEYKSPRTRLRLKQLSFTSSVQHSPANPPPTLFPVQNPVPEMSWLV
mmetsp:Transcript_30869/g.34426  ORF Transcript_30869/g.34426 Transcript_30869/m.34426 type:complete len:257 (+) Transcript_30869:175-945(+)